MHKLSRQVRFCVNPFLAETAKGYNSYSARPCGEGLSLYFGLWVELAGPIDDRTGFVVNVAAIDRIVRAEVVPIFEKKISEKFSGAEHIGLDVVYEMLTLGWDMIADKFGPAALNKLCFELTPFRKIAIKREDRSMYYFSEKFEFAATHTLWNEDFNEEKNFEAFGKCANPAGHGHNYIIEVTVANKGNSRVGIGKFQKIVEDEFVRLVDHKNLNVDVPQFGEKNPTVENIAAFAWERLADKLFEGEITSVTVWENDRTYCTYCGKKA